MDDLEVTKHKIGDMERLLAAQRHIAENIMAQLNQALSDLSAAKPNERNEMARRYAITITEVEKIAAYFQVYIVESIDELLG